MLYLTDKRKPNHGGGGGQWGGKEKEVKEDCRRVKDCSRTVSDAVMFYLLAPSSIGYLNCFQHVRDHSLLLHRYKNDEIQLNWYTVPLSDSHFLTVSLIRGLAWYPSGFTAKIILLNM
jgi:hypothetical protein